MCSGPTDQEPDEVLLSRPVDVSVKKGDVCDYTIITDGCNRNAWMEIGQCALHHSHSNQECNIDHEFVRNSCRAGNTWIITVRIMINDRFIRALNNHLRMQVAFVISVNRMQRNYTAQIHLKSEPEVTPPVSTITAPTCSNSQFTALSCSLRTQQVSSLFILCDFMLTLLLLFA